MKRPNFFIVGAHKCGTTSLWHYVRQHPDIFTPRIKELNYFSCTVPANKPCETWPENRHQQRRKRWYFRQFQSATHETAVGEASPTYFFCREAPRRIKRSISDPKCIILLRDPVKRLYSHFQMKKRIEGWKESFPAFVKERDQRFQALATISHYRGHIAHYLDLFPRKRVLILLTDDLKQNPDYVMERVFHFLDVDPKISIDTERRHGVAKTPKFSRFNYRFLNGMLATIGKRTHTWMYRAPPVLQAPIYHLREWGKACCQFAYKQRPSSEHLAPEIAAALRPMFTRDVRYVESLLDRELEKWHGFTK